MDNKNNDIIGNNVTLNYDWGIDISYSSNNNILYNTISNNAEGIVFYPSCSNNYLMYNNISLNDNYGLYISDSSNNNISGNTISSNVADGIYQQSSEKNQITANEVTNNKAGIYLSHVSNSTISKNNISSNREYGICLSYSYNITLLDNNFTIDGIFIRGGDEVLYYNSHNIPTNNIVNGKPLYYHKDSNGITIDAIPVGQLIIVNSTDVRVENLIINNTDIGIESILSAGGNITNNIITNNLFGVTFAFASNQYLISNNISSTEYMGIMLFESLNSTITKNDIWNNSYGIYLWDSSNNSVYHNNIIGNLIQAYDDSYNNSWNDSYPSGGNYWSDYGGIDLNSTPTQDIPPPDGIGDTPYVIDADSQDNYPLMEPIILLAVPSAPENLQADSGNEYVNLTWEAPFSDGGSAITHYNIYRNGTTGLYDLVPASQLWYNDTNVINGITYTYNVSANNSFGEGPLSIGTSATPMTIPLAPRNLQADAGESHVNLIWEVPSDDGGSPITGYNIYRSGTSIVYAFIPANQLWYNDTNAINGITYTYNISAMNIIGEGPTSIISETPMSVPSAPQNLQADAGDGYVYLIWEVPLYDGGSPILNYRIYRSTTSGDETFLVEIGNTVYYNDTSVANNITYFYKVSAKNAVGEGAFSNEANATPEALSVTPETPSDEDDEIPWLWIIIPIIIAVCAIILFIIAYKRRKRKEEEPLQES